MTARRHCPCRQRGCGPWLHSGKMNGTEELQFVDSFEKVDLALANVAAVRDAVGS